MASCLWIIFESLNANSLIIGESMKREKFSVNSTRKKRKEMEYKIKDTTLVFASWKVYIFTFRAVDLYRSIVRNIRCTHW